MDKKKSIIVPWGLTAFSEYAYEYAVLIGNNVNNNIKILRTINKQRDRNDIEQDMKSVVEELKKKYNVIPEIIFTNDDIYKSIREVNTHHNANLIIKHVGEIKGIERLTGSKTLKMISASKVPFMVVHKPPTHNKFLKIVCPIDYTIETKEKVAWAIYLAQYYKTKIHIIAVHSSFVEVRKKINANINIILEALVNRGIDYEIVRSDKTVSLDDFIINYSQSINADLIMIMMAKSNRNFFDIRFNIVEENIINNKAQIPVLCINPRTDLRKLAEY